MLLFIISLIRPENSLCSDIGHHSFLAANSGFKGNQKGLQASRSQSFSSLKRPSSSGRLILRIVLVGMYYLVNPCICFWPSWRRDATGSAVTLRIARSFHFILERVRSRDASTIIVREVYLNRDAAVNGKWEQKGSAILAKCLI